MGLIRFALPAFAIVGSFYFVAFTEENWKWKLLIFLLAGSSLVLQFAVPVHFVIPMLLPGRRHVLDHHLLETGPIETVPKETVCFVT